MLLCSGHLIQMFRCLPELLVSSNLLLVCISTKISGLFVFHGHNRLEEVGQEVISNVLCRLCCRVVHEVAETYGEQCIMFDLHSVKGWKLSARIWLF